MTEERGEGVYNVVVIGRGTAVRVTAATTAALGGREARVSERRARMAPHDFEERLASLGVHVFRGAAPFVSPHEVEARILDKEDAAPRRLYAGGWSARACR